VLAAVGLPFVIAGGAIAIWLPRSIATQAQQIARLPVSTAATLTERGATVVVEGQVSDRTPPSDQPPLVAYREYRQVTQDGETQWESRGSYTPPLWVETATGPVVVAQGYRFDAYPSRVEASRDRRYEGFKAADPVLVIGTLSRRDPPPLIDAAQLGSGTQADYLLSLAEGEQTAGWLGRLFVGLGAALLLGAGIALYLTRPAPGDP
jgi:hypothetical protein